MITSNTISNNTGSGHRPRVALVGCGTVGAIHRARLAQEPADVVAVCDPDADALARMAEQLPTRPRLFRTEQDLLAAGGVDAVVLCTPHAHHAQQVRAALNAGVHVLCEKPFVTDEAEARALIALARRKNRALFVSYTRRSRGHARFLAAAAGRIGPITHVVATRAQPWLSVHARTWRVRNAEGGGFLLDTGASVLDLLLRLIDSPVESVDAILFRDAHAPVIGGGVDVRASLRLGFASGARADLSLLGDVSAGVERIDLFGATGSAGWAQREGAAEKHELWVRPAGGPTETGDPRVLRSPLPDAAFVAALRSGRSFGADSAPDLHDAASSLPVIALIERIYQEAVWK